MPVAIEALAPPSVAVSTTGEPCSTVIDAPVCPPPLSVVVSVEVLPKPPAGGDSSEKYVAPPGAIAGEKLIVPAPVVLKPSGPMLLNHDVGPS